MQRRVIIESPFGGPDKIVKRNVAYLRRCLRDSLMRGEAPFASHGLYTQRGVLDDTQPDERRWGILAGFEWRIAAHSTVVYTDYGITTGMRVGIEHAESVGCAVEYRSIGIDSSDSIVDNLCYTCGIVLQHGSPTPCCSDCASIKQ